MQRNGFFFIHSKPSKGYEGRLYKRQQREKIVLLQTFLIGTWVFTKKYQSRSFLSLNIKCTNLNINKKKITAKYLPLLSSQKSVHPQVSGALVIVQIINLWPTAAVAGLNRTVALASRSRRSRNLVAVVSQSWRTVRCYRRFIKELIVLRKSIKVVGVWMRDVTLWCAVSHRHTIQRTSYQYQSITCKWRQK